MYNKKFGLIAALSVAVIIIILASINIISTQNSGTSLINSPSGVINLSCGEDYKISIDTDKKIAYIIKPGATFGYYNGRVTKYTGYSDGPYQESVTIDDNTIEFGTSFTPNASIVIGSNGECNHTSINRISGLMTFRAGCLLGGEEDYRAICVPGATTFDKKF